MVLNLPPELEVFDMRFEGIDYLVVERDSLMRVLDAVRRPSVKAPAVVQEPPANKPEPAPVATSPKPAALPRRSETTTAKKPRHSPIAVQILAQLPGTVAEVAGRLGWDNRRVSLTLNDMKHRGGLVENVGHVWRAIPGVQLPEAPAPNAPPHESDRDLVRRCLREYGKPMTSLDVRAWCMDRGRKFDTGTVLSQMAAEGELTVSGNVRDRSYALVEPKTERKPEAPAGGKATNKELVRRAIIDGPKTALQAAQWVRANGNDAMNESLAGVLLNHLQREGEVEEVNAIAPNQDSIWKKSGEKE
jgi:hypothetical protein